ncbi:MAG TPA: DNA polymerase/3'-5' exonuclease PolX [Bacteroidota bacterium]|nr:DNA polymerase/3'-5' exonuclease PolX [Bacteroidota bacterium]
MDKKSIAAVLDEMGTLLELQGANPFKSRAFHNASRAVEGITEDLQALVAAGKLTEIKGIGASIGAIIADLAVKGKSKEYTDLRKGFPDGVLEMLKIQGLGPKKVKILFDKQKIRTLDQLEKAAKAGRLASLEGFGKKSEENILAGIQALRSRSDKHLFSSAYESARSLHDHMMKQKGVVRCEIAGSLRRRKEIIGDIDIVLSARDGDRTRLMAAFVAHPDVTAVVAQGDTKSSVTLASGINCDLRIVDDAEFPFALNYFTGSKEHNVELRTRAKKYGLSLNEYGFSRLGEEEKRGKGKKAVRCDDEEGIYRALEMAYVPPELRENRGEIEAAIAGNLPELLRVEDIRGTFHCHTTYSDGVNTLEQMAAGAKSHGWEYLGIGDHSKVAAYAGGLSREKLAAQFREIDELNALMKPFRLLKGTECDILPDGTLDWSDGVLATFDYVVVSIHSNFKMTESAMTKRIIRALKNKYVTMLGHPTGRLLLARDAYPVNMTDVINAAADYGRIIEINAHPTRLDLDWRLCPYAKEKGVMIAINPDAHTVEGLNDVAYGVGIARKGWLSKNDVLNARPLGGVMQYLAQHQTR